MEAVDKAMKAQQVAREQPERVGEGGPMPEMWLSYPPLAGKHLMVAEGTQGGVFFFGFSVFVASGLCVMTLGNMLIDE